MSVVSAPFFSCVSGVFCLFGEMEFSAIPTAGNCCGCATTGCPALVVACSCFALSTTRGCLLAVEAGANCLVAGTEETSLEGAGGPLLSFLFFACAQV